MARESIKEKRLHRRAELENRKKLMEEYNETRDPLLLYIYKEEIKIRKWLDFFGAVFIIGSIIAFFVWLLS